MSGQFWVADSQSRRRFSGGLFPDGSLRVSVQAQPARAAGLLGEVSMDSFEWNKIAGAVLATTLFVLAVRVIADAAFDVEPLEKQAYVIEVTEPAAAPAGGAAPAAEPDPDFGTVLVSANAQNGASVA